MVFIMWCLIRVYIICLLDFPSKNRIKMHLKISFHKGLGSHIVLECNVKYKKLSIVP